MTYEQYWFGDVWLVDAYREADRERLKRKNAEFHLQGMYFYDALLCALSSMSPKGSKKSYPSEPYQLFEDKVKEKEKEDKEALWAKAYMSQMARASKTWGKE